MENKLLFKSGRWNIELQGKQALIRLSKVLEENPDISILLKDILITFHLLVEVLWNLIGICQPKELLQ